jgi:hypothetical protein
MEEFLPFIQRLQTVCVLLDLWVSHYMGSRAHHRSIVTCRIGRYLAQNEKKVDGDDSSIRKPSCFAAHEGLIHRDGSRCRHLHLRDSFQKVVLFQGRDQAVPRTRLCTFPPAMTSQVQNALAIAIYLSRVRNCARQKHEGSGSYRSAASPVMSVRGNASAYLLAAD